MLCKLRVLPTKHCFKRFCSQKLIRFWYIFLEQKRNIKQQHINTVKHHINSRAEENFCTKLHESRNLRTRPKKNERKHLLCTTTFAVYVVAQRFDLVRKERTVCSHVCADKSVKHFLVCTFRTSPDVHATWYAMRLHTNNQVVENFYTKTH